jgi:hypothetical protein
MIINNTLTPRQLMLSPDVLAIELGQIKTPEKIEKNKIVTYFIIGVVATITVGLFSYAVYQMHQENKRKKQN